MTLTEKLRRAAEIRKMIAGIVRDAEEATGKLRAEIAYLEREIRLEGAMIDVGMVDLARTVVLVRGAYEQAGDDRASVVADAIHQIATGEKRGYLGLDHELFGTKSYDRWHGQRCDCTPGMGPSHGSLIFQIGLTKQKRENGGVAALTDEEREAALYLLTRLQAVQAAEAAP